MLVSFQFQMQKCKVMLFPTNSVGHSDGPYPIWFDSMFEFCQKMIHSIFDSILLYPRFNSKYYSIKKNLLIQFKRYFNSIVKESLILVENCPKSSKIDKKRVFSSKMTNIDAKYVSFIHVTIKFNSKDYSISISYQEYLIKKIIQ